MKGRIESLKSAAGTSAVRGVGATAVLVPLASVVGYILHNHNETFVHDGGAPDAEPQQSAVTEKIESATARSAAAVVALLPLASVLGALTFNHNETLLRDPQS